MFFKIPWCGSIQLEKGKQLNSYLNQQSFTDKLLDRRKIFTKRGRLFDKFKLIYFIYHFRSNTPI